MTARDILIVLALKHKGDWNKIFQDIQDKADVPDVPSVKDVVSCITLLDPEYPECLKQIRKPPFVLFYKGDISLLNSPNIIGFTGSRTVTCTKDTTKSIIKELKEVFPKVATVSGLAKGCDTLSHLNSIMCDIPTIAVLGSGIDNIYPAENKELADSIVESGGLLISEYPFNGLPAMTNFPLRDRIIAGLSQKLVVLECRPNSGTYITCALAIENGKDVYVIPTEAKNNTLMNNTLIKQGAYMITKASDLL